MNSVIDSPFGSGVVRWCASHSIFRGLLVLRVGELACCVGRPIPIMRGEEPFKGELEACAVCSRVVSLLGGWTASRPGLAYYRFGGCYLSDFLGVLFTLLFLPVRSGLA